MAIKPFSRAEFTAAYAAELLKRVTAAKPGSDYDWTDKSPEECARVAEKMTRNYFNRQGAGLSSSPAAKAAAGIFGITTTAGLESALMAEFEAQPGEVVTTYHR